MRQVRSAGLILVLMAAALGAQARTDTARSGLDLKDLDAPTVKFLMTYKLMPAQKMGEEFEKHHFKQETIDNILDLTGASSARKDSVKKAYEDALEVSQQGAAADTGKKAKKPTSSKRIPITKEAPEATATVETKTGHTKVTTTAETKGNTASTQVVVSTCGNWFGCHPGIVTAAKFVGGTILVGGVAELVASCLKGKGMCGGGGDVTQTATQTVNALRAPGIRFSFPVP